jgi:ketosteroid isomerase-like protein
MSESALEIVRRSGEAFEPDVDAWLATLDPGFEWFPLEEGNMRSEGHEAALRIRERWLESWESHEIEVEELMDGGDDVVGVLHLRGRGRASGAEVDMHFFMHWKVRDGKIVYLYEHADRGEALRAAGIEQ